MLSILFFNAATACIPAFMSTFGPKLGLRQMTSARYSWGFWGAKIVALLNCIACVGWSIVNTISGAQTLVAVSEYKISAAVGVVIIALVTLFIGLFGYRFVHQYERYSWLPTFITFLVMLGVSAKHLANVPWGVGQAEAAGVLSFGGTIWGFAIGWSSLKRFQCLYACRSQELEGFRLDVYRIDLPTCAGRMARYCYRLRCFGRHRLERRLSRA